MTPGSPTSGPLRAHALTAAERKRVIEVARGCDAYLAWRGRDGELRLVALDGERSQTIGRSPRMDVAIDDPQVSGFHARLECHAGGWSLVDDGLSKNGTFVGDTRVVGRARLVDGELIRVGRTIVAFCSPSAPRIAPTMPDDRPPTRALTARQRSVLVALCRPLLDDVHARVPATNEQIASELCLSVGAVKMHLRALFAAFGLDEVRQNEKRARLASHAIDAGVVGRHDLAR